MVTGVRVSPAAGQKNGRSNRNGFVEKNAPIWVGNLIGLVMDLLMVIGIIVHAGATF